MNTMMTAAEWAPNRRHEDMCQTYGLDLVAEAESFIEGATGRTKTQDHWDRIFTLILKDHSKRRQPSPVWERHVTAIEGATDAA